MILASCAHAFAQPDEPFETDDFRSYRPMYDGRYASDFYTESRLAVVPGACTNSEEPQLEIRKLPYVDLRSGHPLGVWDADLIAFGFGSPSLGLARTESYGKLTYTVDGGRTWLSLGSTAGPSEPGASYTGVEIAFVDDQIGWAIGFGGLTLRRRAVATFDGGRNWREYLAWSTRWEPMAELLAGTRIHDGRWQMPDGARVTAAFASTDGGFSWFALSTPASQAEAVAAATHYDRLVLFGDQGLFISVSDLVFPIVDTDWRDLAPALFKPMHEVNFGMTAEPFTDLTNPQAHWALPPDYASGSRPYQAAGTHLQENLPSYLMRTQDGGQTWHDVPLRLPIDLAKAADDLGVDALHAEFRDIVMVDESHGWLTLALGVPGTGDSHPAFEERWVATRTFCTGDGATTWHAVGTTRHPSSDGLYVFDRSGNRHRAHAIFALDSRHIWIDWTSYHTAIYRVAPIETEWWPAGHPPTVDQSSAVE